MCEFHGLRGLRFAGCAGFAVCGVSGLRRLRLAALAVCGGCCFCGLKIESDLASKKVDVIFFTWVLKFCEK